MSIVRQTWGVHYFNLVCAILKYWSEQEVMKTDKNASTDALDSLVKYSSVISRSEEEEDGGSVRVTLTNARDVYIGRILGRYEMGCPSTESLDLTIDYVALSEEETKKWQQERKEQKEARAKYLAEVKEAERQAKAKAKEDALQKDLQQIRDYIADRPNVSIVKARMARELNIPYNRCLELCKLLV